MLYKQLHGGNVCTVVWVTGAGRGIGKAIAQAFAAVGAMVVISARTSKEINKVAEEILNSGSNKAIPLVCDVATEKSVKTTFEKIFRKFGRIDVLVNNAGTAYFKPIIETTAREFDETINSNLRGMFLCTRAVLPAMIRQRSGHIFNILSVAATTTFTESGAYGAAKAGGLMFTNVLREEVRQYNIKVVAVLPGATETAIWGRRVRQRYRERMMQPGDIAEAVVAIYKQSPRMVTEEIIIRPILGDL